MHVERFVGLTMEVDAQPPDVVVVVLRGELDECNIERVATVLDGACDGTSGDMQLVLDELDFLGVSGAALLRQVDRRLALEGRRVVVERASRAVHRAMECVGASTGPRPAPDLPSR